MNHKKKNLKVLKIREATKNNQSPFTCPACQEKRKLEFLGWNEEEEDIRSEPALVFFCKSCSELFVCNYGGIIFWRNLGSLSSSAKNSSNDFGSMSLLFAGNDDE